MIIAKNDEAKRSKIWGIVTTVSSALIVLIAIYLLMKLFMGNPIKGTWESEDGNLTLEIMNHGSMYVKIQDIAEGTDAKVKASYTIDKEMKTISIREDVSELRKATEKANGAFEQETLKNAVSGVMTTFTYSVEGKQLTLSEREYGEQLTFIRK